MSGRSLKCVTLVIILVVFIIAVMASQYASRTIAETSNIAIQSSNEMHGQQSATGLTAAKSPEKKNHIAWEFLEHIAITIEGVPAWSKNGPSTFNDWRLLFEAAIRLQELHPDDVYAIFVMVATRQFNATDREQRLGRALGSSRAMLILRIMFDVPDDPVQVVFSGEELLKKLEDPSYLTVCGNWLYEAFDKDAVLKPNLLLPFEWVDGDPKLVAYPVSSVGSGPSYQPHLEYINFRGRFKLRTDLREWLREWIDKNSVRVPEGGAE